jgi:SAM-dependent methyltransferase
LIWDAAPAVMSVYMLAQLVGPAGEVIGVDMTEQQLAVAERHRLFHREAFGFDNVRFVHGYIERLEELDLSSGSFDVIASNYVVNLYRTKTLCCVVFIVCCVMAGSFISPMCMLTAAYPGRFAMTRYFTANAREAPYTGTIFCGWRIAIGLPIPGWSTTGLLITDPSLASRVGNLRFFSATYRLFKLDAIETACEDYGQAVIYRGSIAHHEDRFALDTHHDIETGRVFPVCGNTWRILHDTRFAPTLTS